MGFSVLIGTSETYVINGDLCASVTKMQHESLRICRKIYKAQYNRIFVFIDDNICLEFGITSNVNTKISSFGETFTNSHRKFF